METIRMIGASVCITMVVTAIFSMLIPDNKPEKLLRFSISLFFLTGLISPFVGKSISFYIEPPAKSRVAQEQALETQISESFVAAAQTRLEQQLSDALKKEGILPLKITVSVHIDETNGISIKQPIIIVDEKTYLLNEKIGEVTKNVIGYDPKILMPESQKQGEEKDE